VGPVGQPAPSCSARRGRGQPGGWPARERLGNARDEEVCAFLCHPVGCLRNVLLLLLGTDAGDGTRPFLGAETSLEMENMVCFSRLLQRCLVGLLDAGLGSAQIPQRKAFDPKVLWFRSAGRGEPRRWW